jgi:hypothetical protein
VLGFARVEGGGGTRHLAALGIGGRGVDGLASTRTGGGRGVAAAKAIEPFRLHSLGCLTSGGRRRGLNALERRRAEVQIARAGVIAERTVLLGLTAEGVIGVGGYLGVDIGLGEGRAADRIPRCGGLEAGVTRRREVFGQAGFGGEEMTGRVVKRLGAVAHRVHIG